VGEDLRALQQRFFRLITAPDGEDAPLTAWLAFDAEASARERAQVYRQAYAFRLLEAVRDDYPGVAALAAGQLEAMVAEYSARHPPSHPSLRHFGARFAAFAAEHALARRWPWLGDLAALEWARVEVFDAPDVPLLALAELDAIDSADWPSHVFALAPCVRVLTLPHPVHHAWRALEDGQPVPAITAARTDVLVFRRQFVPCHRVLGAREADALRRVQRKSAFAQVCEALAGDESLDRAAGAALGAVAQWIIDGLLAR
jgi:hypothetical protein